MSLKWTDSLDIAIDLSEKYPEIDPKYIRLLIYINGLLN